LPPAGRRDSSPNGDYATNCDYSGNVVSWSYEVDTEYEVTADLEVLRGHLAETLVQAGWLVQDVQASRPGTELVAESAEKNGATRVQIIFAPVSGTNPPRIDVKHSAPCARVAARK